MERSTRDKYRGSWIDDFLFVFTAEDNFPLGAGLRPI
jgi:hypothetical protein